MGFITKQWLKGSVERNPGLYPEKAALRLLSTTTNWCKRNGVAAQIGATGNNGDYQTISFTATELNEFSPILAIGADIEVRKRITQRTLLVL